MLLERSVDQWLADKKKMTKYICERIPDDGIRIELANNDEEDAVWADLFPTWNDDAGRELLIESNEPEWASVEEVYNYFRRKDMTLLEWQQERLWERSRYTSLDLDPTEQPSEVTPYWDADLGEFWFGDKPIKAFREEAQNQKVVLAKFQELEWRHRIDDPIPNLLRHRPSYAKRRLRDTITGLNANHITPGVIRFRGDGSGKGVIWVLCE